MRSNMSPDEINSLLKQARLSQSGLARDLGVNPSSVFDVIRGKVVSVRIQTHVARAIGMSRDEVFPETVVDDAGRARKGRPPGRGLFDDDMRDAG